MYQKDDPSGPWSVWLSISFVLPPLALPFSCVWLWRTWQSGFGRLCCDHLRRKANWHAGLVDVHTCRAVRVCATGRLEQCIWNISGQGRALSVLHGFGSCVCLVTTCLSPQDFVSNWVVPSCSLCPLFEPLHTKGFIPQLSSLSLINMRRNDRTWTWAAHLHHQN